MIVVVTVDLYLVVCREVEVVLLEQHQLGGCRRQDGLIIGQATDTGLLSSALPNQNFFISRVHNSVGLQRMAQHIRNQGFDFVELTLTSHELAVYNSLSMLMIQQISRIPISGKVVCLLENGDTKVVSIL